MARRIDIYWSRPMTLDALGDHAEGRRDCLYAIVGASRSWMWPWMRRRRLFYLGFSERHIFDRLADPDHKLELIRRRHERRWDIRVRVGHVDPGENRRLSRRLALEVESALIWWHTPEYNVASTRTFTGRDMTIRNLTESGRGAIPGLDRRVAIR